ncbi:TPA: HNH endonuclease [Vibrio vulnificus]
MVSKLPIPPYDSIHILQTVIDERVHHSDFFEAMKDDWIAGVLSYRENAGSPHFIRPLNLSAYISEDRLIVESKKVDLADNEDYLAKLVARRTNSLQGLYKPDSSKELYTILATMRDKHQLRFCPCCGEPGKPGTLDHYLPRSVYPEFSIVIENLTPMCSVCQNYKGNKVLDEQGHKAYLHPYFDPIDLVPIRLDIHPPFSSPSGFIASVPKTVPVELRELVERHLREVNFVSRFEDFCSHEYSDLLSTLAQDKLDPQRETVVQSIERFLNKANRKDQNFWEAIFYRGVLTNPELLEFLEASDLTEFR